MLGPIYTSQRPMGGVRRVLSASTGSISAAEYGGTRTTDASTSYKVTVEAPVTFQYAGAHPVFPFANVLAGASAAALEAANSGSVKVQAAWRASGTTRWHMMTFRGQKLYTCSAGEIVESDPLPIRHVNGTAIDVRLYVDGSTGSVPLPGTIISNASALFKADYNNNATDGSTLTDDVSGSGAFIPWFLGVHSIPDNPNQSAALVIGDSITDGNTAITGYSAFKVGRGWPCQLLTALNVPWSVASEIGVLAQSLVANTALATTHVATTYLLRFVTHVVMALGVNDINNGRTAVQLEGDLTSLVSTFTDAGLKVIVPTITPFSAAAAGGSGWDGVTQTSTYGGGWNATKFGYLATVNDWIRAGSLVSTARVLEAADVIQVVRNAYQAKTAYLNTAGATPDTVPVHPNPTGEAALVSALTTSMQAALAS